MWSAAMDVGKWLKGIGLGQYEATFREHEIDAEVLSELTEADLEKFGVPFGHRKASSRRSRSLVTQARPELISGEIPHGGVDAMQHEHLAGGRHQHRRHD
jgi:hypothetical protein